MKTCARYLWVDGITCLWSLGEDRNGPGTLHLVNILHPTNKYPERSVEDP
jgi:hypothetical protein